MAKPKPDPEAAARRAEAELARRRTEERLKYYKPYPKQASVSRCWRRGPRAAA
jgi:hypothetical protein